MSDAITLTNIYASYNKKPVLIDINLNVKKASTHFIIGPSGAGKTTLIKIINGLIAPESGNARVLGIPVTPSSLRGLRRSIGYIPQDMGLISHATVLENVLFGALGRMRTIPSLLKLFPQKDTESALELIAELGLEDKQERHIHDLSGGEKRRVAIARALMQNPKILLADEILSDVDFIQAKHIMNLITKLMKKRDLTALIVEHDLCMVKRCGETASLLKEGKLTKNIPLKLCSEKELCENFHS